MPNFTETFYKKNKNLSFFTLLSFLQILFLVLLYVLYLQFCSKYASIISVLGSTTQDKTFFNFIYESGKVSNINQTLTQVMSDSYKDNVDNLLKNFFQSLTIDSSTNTVASSGVATTADKSSATTHFHTFNAIIQLSVFFYTLNWLVFLTCIGCFVYLTYVACKKNKLYELIKAIGCWLFNIFGWALFAYFEHTKIDHTFNWPIYNYDWKWVQLAQNLQNKNKSWIKIYNQPLISVENLSFSYQIKHNVIKHYWDLYRQIKENNKFNENDHLFAFKLLFTKNKQINYLLKNINLTIHPGSFNVIIGPNGSGKSTLIKLLVNILPDHLNSIKWFGNLVSDINKKTFYQKIAYLPQDMNIPDLVNIYDFLSFSRLPHGNFQNKLSLEDHLSILKAIKESGCYEFNAENINELSGGQKQKVFIASILSKNSEVIVLDEPTSFFDLKNQIKFLDFLKKLQQDGKTIIIILHDLEQAINYATNIIVLNKSVIYDQGEPRKIINKKLLSEVFKIDCDINFNDKQSTLTNIMPIENAQK